MVDYPYILNTGSLREFLKKLPKMRVPEKVTLAYLSSIGLKSRHDRPIVKILKYIGFLNGSGVPTEQYKDFRVGSKSRPVMASALRSAYADLFGIYDDAYRKDTEALRDFFAQATRAGESVITSTVQTFKVLCEFADFQAPPLPTKAAAEEAEEPLRAKTRGYTPEKRPRISINIELHLPATQDASIYDKIFKSLKEHLFES